VKALIEANPSNLSYNFVKVFIANNKEISKVLLVFALTKIKPNKFNRYSARD
jgi:hypothetical protein